MAALEMELNLVRSRFARETMMCGTQNDLKGERLFYTIVSCIFIVTKEISTTKHVHFSPTEEPGQQKIIF